MLSLIAALAKNNVIGQDNKLPWHIPEDMRHFRHLTLGKSVIMGRKTYESIGKPLAKRHNIVVTRNPEFKAEGVQVCHSLDEALEQTAGQDEVIIMGGAQLYVLAMPRVDKMYLTLIDKEIEGDTCFPHFEANDWQETDRADLYSEKADLNFSFVTLERKP